MDTKRLVVSIAVCALASIGAGVLATTPVTTAIQPSSGFIDSETPVALAGRDFMSGMRFALVAGGGHEVLHMPLYGISGVAFAGNFAFVATSTSLVTLNVSRPEAPVVVGSIALTDWPGTLRAADKRLFLGAYNAGGYTRLKIYDASDPLLPRLTAEVPFDVPLTQFGYARGFLYLPRASYGFDVYDVRGDGVPVQVFRYRESGFRVEAIEIVGSRAFVAGMISTNEGATYPIVEILDVSNLAAPWLLASGDLPGTVGRLAPAGDGVLLSNSQGLAAVAYDGTYIARVQTVRQGGSVPSFVTSDGTCAVWYHGVIESLDISDPFAPFVRGRFPATPDVAPYGLPLGFRSGYVYWGLNSGLEVYNVCEAFAAAPAHERSHRWGLKDVAFSANRVHFLDSGGQLHVTDVTDPAAPRVIGATQAIAFGDRVAAADSLAFIAGQTWSWYDRGMLSIVDEAAGGAVLPVIGSASLLGPPAAIEAAGAHVFVGGWSALWGGSLEIVDVSRPREPIVVARLDGLSRPWTITAGDGYLYYFSDWTLTVIDVSDPARPFVAATVPGLGWPTDSVRAGDRLYLAEIVPFSYDRGNVSVFDLADPLAPAHLADLPIEGFPLGVDADDVRLVVTTDRAGVFSYELQYMPPRVAQSFAEVGDFIGLFDGFASVHRPGTWAIYALNEPVENVSESSDTCGAATIPAGIAKGLYDIVTTCPHEHGYRFRDAYRSCEHHTFSTGLETFPVVGQPLPWDLVVEGDDVFFSRRGSHSAKLLLPQLPASYETKYGRLGVPAQQVIVIDVSPDLAIGMVSLFGDNRAAVEALWAKIRTEGGVALPVRNDHTYGSLQLSSTPEGVPSRWGTLLNQFTYTFDSGRLISAIAKGGGVDLVFEATGSDDIRCATPARTTYSEGLREACDTWGPHYPGMIPNCSW